LLGNTKPLFATPLWQSSTFSSKNSRSLTFPGPFQSEFLLASTKNGTHLFFSEAVGAKKKEDAELLPRAFWLLLR